MQTYVKVRRNTDSVCSGYTFNSLGELSYFLLGYTYSKRGYSFEKKDNAGKTWVVRVSADLSFELCYLDRSLKRAFTDGWELWDGNHNIIEIRMQPYSIGYPPNEDNNST